MNESKKTVDILNNTNDSLLGNEKELDQKTKKSSPVRTIRTVRTIQSVIRLDQGRLGCEDSIIITRDMVEKGIFAVGAIKKSL